MLAPNFEKPRLSLRGFRRGTPAPAIAEVAAPAPISVRATKPAPRFTAPQTVADVRAVRDQLAATGEVPTSAYRMPPAFAWLEKCYGKITLRELAKRFPNRFDGPRQALKIGIDADITERCPDLGVWAIACALKGYVGQIGYLEQMVVGAKRVDLDGAIDQEQATNAVARLKSARAAIEAYKKWRAS